MKGMVEGCSVEFAVFGGPPVKSLSLPADVKEDGVGRFTERSLDVH